MKLSGMANGLRKYGLTVVETKNWANRGYAGLDIAEVRGTLVHHTATNRNAFKNSNAPTLNLCINGRSDLPGPLCQIVFGRDGTVYLSAAGLSNHAGVGSAPGIPANMGNYYLIGIECESSGVAPWDWTPDQLRVLPYLCAALELLYMQHLPPAQRLLLGHKEYSSEGKIDPAGFSMDWLRAETNKAIAVLRGGKAPTPAPPKKPAKKPAAVKPAASSTVAWSGITWTVSKGDTLWSVAEWGYGKGGAKKGVANIKKLNGLKSDSLRVGQKLKLPAPMAWITDPGDTIAKVARRYGLHPDALRRANPILKGVGDHVVLHAGQALQIKV